MEDFLAFLVTVISAHVLEGYPCHLKSPLKPYSFPCLKSYAIKSGGAHTLTSHEGEEAAEYDTLVTSPALSFVVTNDLITGR